MIIKLFECELHSTATSQKVKRWKESAVQESDASELLGIEVHLQKELFKTNFQALTVITV